MFEIHLNPAGEVVMAGRLDATQCEAALHFLNALPAPRIIDLARLDYIASAGLRVLLLTQKRAKGSGAGIRLINLTAPDPRHFPLRRLRPDHRHDPSPGGPPA